MFWNRKKRGFINIDNSVFQSWLDKWLKILITKDIAVVYKISKRLSCDLLISKIKYYESIYKYFDLTKDIRDSVKNNNKNDVYIVNELLYKLFQLYNFDNHSSDESIISNIKNIKKEILKYNLNKKELEKIISVYLDLKYKFRCDNLKKIIKDYWWILEYLFIDVSSFREIHSLLFRLENFVKFKNIHSWIEDRVSKIIEKLCESWQIFDNDRIKLELKSWIFHTINFWKYKNIEITPQDLSYLSNIKSFLIKITTFNDFWMAIFKDSEWLKYVVKKIFIMKNINCDDKVLDRIYFDFKKNFCHENRIFEKTKYNFLFELWSNSFMRVAYDSCVNQSRDISTMSFKQKEWFVKWIFEGARKTLYWENAMKKLVEYYTTGRYSTDDWDIDLDVLIDMIYILWSIHTLYDKWWLYVKLKWFFDNRMKWMAQWAKDIHEIYWNWERDSWIFVMYLTLIFSILLADWDLMHRYSNWRPTPGFLWSFISWNNEIDIPAVDWPFVSELDRNIYKEQWLLWFIIYKKHYLLNDLICNNVLDEEYCFLWNRFNTIISRLIPKETKLKKVRVYTKLFLPFILVPLIVVWVLGCFFPFFSKVFWWIIEVISALLSLAFIYFMIYLCGSFWEKFDKFLDDKKKFIKYILITLYVIFSLAVLGLSYYLIEFLRGFWANKFPF